MTAEFEELSVPSLAGSPPLLPWAKFADWIQIEPGIVRGWMDRGYSKFTGFPDQPKTVSAARTHSIQSRAHAPSELVKGTCDRAQAVSRS